MELLSFKLTEEFIKVFSQKKPYYKHILLHYLSSRVFHSDHYIQDKNLIEPLDNYNLHVRLDSARKLLVLTFNV